MHTVGLVSPEDPSTAVCLIPGSQVLVSGVCDSRRALCGIPDGVAIATFKQRDIPGGTRDYHRDGLVFEGGLRDGHVVLFRELGSGVEVTVETIPGELENFSPPAAALAHDVGSPVTAHDSELVTA
ncbi:hypothetical protein H0X32_01175 [Patescibacteria group bacterium]|nr:hypothetical protein [Patescibacteria group bacterium]